jgi:hypothetical protein
MLDSDQVEIAQFIDDDSGYVNWLKKNADGFVVNSERDPSSAYIIVHRATCKYINTPNRANWTTTGYIKTCANKLSDLHQWARQSTGGTLTPCGACKPDSGSKTAPTLPLVASTPMFGHSSHLPAQAAPTAAIQSAGNRRIPAQISTGCDELDLVWRTYAADILGRPHVLIPDTEEDLNWHAFLGHSIDMQGFRAAEFAGVDPVSKRAPGFVPLNRRGLGVIQLASLWEIEAIQRHLRYGTRGQPVSATLAVLRSEGGSVGTSLAEAFAAFPFRKFHSSIRALLQNSATLKSFGFSFRNWLLSQCQELGTGGFPPADFRQVVPTIGTTIEMELRRRLERAFYQVGPALAPYMICDWQLWLWNEGLTGVFANFKLDSLHTEFVARYGRNVIPPDERGFAEWWLSLFPELPPRLANECIWLGMDRGIV